jgi:hypothetical protein
VLPISNSIDYQKESWTTSAPAQQRAQILSGMMQLDRGAVVQPVEGAMSKDIEQQFEEQAKFWSRIAPPNAVGHNFARELAAAVQGFERARGQLAFEDEPSSFEAALQETKERTP